MRFFGLEYNTSHYWGMSHYNLGAYIDGFFAVEYGDKEAFHRADLKGIVFW